MSTRKAQQGFSLLELTVAMAVTVIITGAMFGLVTSAQTSFRREPALGDRQMQIRIAMDRIQEDLLAAGMNMGPFAQTFTPGLNAAGMIGVRVAGSPTFGGGNTDIVEFKVPVADCPALRVASYASPTYTLTAESQALLNNAANSCYKNEGGAARSHWVLASYLDGNAKWGWKDPAVGSFGFNFNAQPADAAGYTPSQLDTALERTCSLSLDAISPAACPASAPPLPPGNVYTVNYFTQLDVIRYQIALDTDGQPALFRSATGGRLPTGAGAISAPAANSAAWQVIARGIEDMQIRYRIGPPDAAGVLPDWVDTPPTINPVAATNYNGIVRQVEVTLWARTIGEGRLQGQTTAAGNGTTAVRGLLTTTVMPRAAEMALAGAPADNANRWQ